MVLCSWVQAVWKSSWKLKHERRQDFCMENYWKQPGRKQMFGGVGSEGITSGQRVWARCKSLRYGTRLPALWEEGSSKEQLPLPAHLCGRKLPLQLSPWCQTIQVLPMCLWCLENSSPGSRAQREWVWVSPCMDPWRGTTWVSRSFHFPQPRCLLFYYSQKLWGLLSLTLGPWTRGHGMGLGPLPPQPLPSWFIYAPRVCGTSRFYVSALLAVSLSFPL